MAEHCKCALASHVLHAIIFVIFAAFQCMGLGGVPGLFKNGTVAVAEKYDYDVRPNEWVYYVNWALVIVWMAMYHGYRLYTVFALTPDGTKYRYMAAPGWTNNGGILIQQPVQLIAALFMWSNDQAWGAFGFYAGSCIVAAVMLATVQVALPFCEATSRKDGYLRSIMVHNAVAALVMWTFLLTVITLGSCLAHHVETPVQNAGTVVASLILAVALVYFAIEITVLRKWFLHVSVHWTILLITASAMLPRSGGFGTTNWALCLVIILVVVLIYLVKGIVGCWIGHKESSRNSTGDCNVAEEEMKAMEKEGGPL